MSTNHEPPVGFEKKPNVALTWDGARRLYPGTMTTSYLDSAALGLISVRTEDAMTAVLDEHKNRGVAAATRSGKRAADVRAAVAELVGGQVGNVAFSQNTSTGLATVVNGLDWRTGDNVVVPAGEFPSNFYPWLQLKRRGVQVREIPMTDGRARSDDVLAAVDGRTRVLAISAVQYSSGYRYDLGRLGQVCQDQEVLLVVDGTQAVGAMTVDTADMGIDVLAVSAHKWMLGPQGVGFVHFSDRAMQRLAPSTAGWMTVQDPFAFDHEPVFAEDARRFESGTENSVGIAGLGASIALVHELGRQRVEDRILDLVEQLSTLLDGIGMTVHVPAARQERSGIVIASAERASHQVLHAHLLSQGVSCSLRSAGLRFAPHYFTAESDLHRAVEVIREVI